MVLGLPGNAKILLSKLKHKISVAGNIDSDRNANNPQVFSLRTIKVATKNFSSENKLGEGGYGPVYRVIFSTSWFGHWLFLALAFLG